MKGYLGINPGIGGAKELLRCIILSAIILAILRTAGFTGSDLVISFFPLEEVKSITSLSVVDEPSRTAKKVFRFFFTDGSQADDKDLFLQPSLATGSTMVIRRANA